MEEKVVFAGEERVFARENDVVKHLCSLCVLALEEESLPQIGLSCFLCDADSRFSIVDIMLRWQLPCFDSSLQVALNKGPKCFCCGVSGAIFPGLEQMIHYGCGSPKRHQFEVSPRAEEASLGYIASHIGRVWLHMLDNQVGIIDDIVEIDIHTLHQVVVGSEGIFVEFLHLCVVSARSSAAPNVVSKQVFDEEPIVMVGTEADMESSQRLFSLFICLIKGLFTAHIAVLGNVETVFTARYSECKAGRQHE